MSRRAKGSNVGERAATIAVIQMCSGTDVHKNLEIACALVHEAADQGATYIQLPEYFNFYGPASAFADVRETIPGPTTTRLGEIAGARHVNVHIGSMLEISPESEKSYNTSVVLDTSGAPRFTYRKTHLFDIEVPEQISYHESRAIRAGDALVVATLDEFALGMSVCFDVRFPELYRHLALHGASAFAVPAAFSAATGPAHWEVLLRARAIENHAFVFSATQVGTTSEGLSTYGHAMVIDPWGEVLREATSSGEEVLVASIDLDDVATRRSQINVLGRRRPYLYGDLDGGA